MFIKMKGRTGLNRNEGGRTGLDMEMKGTQRLG